MSKLTEKQLTFEHKFVERGAELLYDAQLEIHRGSTPETSISFKRFFKRSTPILSQDLQDWLEDNSVRQTARYRSVLPVFRRGLSCSQVAFLAIVSSMTKAYQFDHTSDTLSMISLASHIGATVDAELKLQWVRENYDIAFSMVRDRSKKDGVFFTGKHQRGLELTLAKRYLSEEDWAKCQSSGIPGNENKVKVGLFLLERIVKSLGIFQVNRVYSRKKSVNTVRLKPQVLKLLDRNLKDFVPLARGKYLGVSFEPYPSRQSKVKGFMYVDDPPLVANTPEAHNPEPVYSENVFRILDNLDSTGYKLNPDLVKFIKDNRAELEHIGVLPRIIPEPELQVFNEHDTPEQRAAWVRHKAKVVEAKRANWKARKAQTQLADLLWFIDEAEDDVFYLRHFYDFRGRIYCASAFANPQGGDLEKALLMFADPGVFDKRNEDHWYYFLNYGADLLGFPRQSRRVVLGLKNILIDLAAKVLEDMTELTKLSKPFLAWTWCKELVRITCESSSVVETHLPIQRDATCSALQHIGSIFNSRPLAALTNVTPSDNPQDAYAYILNRATEVMDSVFFDDYPEGVAKDLRLVKKNLRRQHIKPYVMTIPYGATSLSLMKTLKKAIQTFGVSYLNITEVTRAIHDLIYGTVKADLAQLFDCMVWLLGIFDNIRLTGNRPKFLTPSGFFFDMFYPCYDTERVRIYWYDQTFQLSMTNYDKPRSFDSKRARRAWCANFTHALDAQIAHLTTLTFYLHCNRLALVHDCLWTTVDGMDLAMKTVKVSHKELYTEGLPLILEQLDTLTSKSYNIERPSGNVSDNVTRSLYYWM